MIKLSIIIPVYNVQNHLGKCLNSVINQSVAIGEFEIVIVNDGSTDGSLEICREFETQYKNVILIDQNNKGLSGARNAGLKVARGEYVWFIDSDDWITDISFDEIDKIISKKKVDVLVLSSADHVKGKYQLRNELKAAFENKYDNIEYLKSKYFEVGVVIYVFNRTFLQNNNFKFYEGITHEDTEFTYKVIYQANTINYINKICYVVNLRDGSITRSFNPKRSFDLLTVCNILHIYKDLKVRDEDKHFFVNIISMLFNNALHNIYCLDKKYITRFEAELDKNTFLISNLKKSSILKYKIEGILMSLPGINRVKVYKLMKSLSF